MTAKTFHPVHACDDGKFNTVSGNIIDLHYPTVDMINIEDIARSLSNFCRFGGHVNQFYSVAEHSMLVCALAPAELKPYALLHDATEAYLGDVIKPLKNILGSPYDLMEQTFEHRICQCFGLNADLMRHIKPFDKKAIEVEFEALQRSNYQPLVELNRNGVIAKQFGMPPEAAMVRFMQHFYQLFPDHREGIQWNQYIGGPFYS